MPAWVAPAIIGAASIAGSAISSHVSNKQAEKRRKEQNKFNSPAQQIRRLKDAGVSPSYYYSGGGMVTSDAGYDQPYKIDPDLGVAKGIEGYQKVQSATIQQEMAQAQLDSIQIQNQIKRKELAGFDQQFNLKMAKLAQDTKLDAAKYNWAVQAESARIQIQQQLAGYAGNKDKREQELAKHQMLLDNSYYMLKEADTRFQQEYALRNLVLDYMKTEISRGHLGIAQKQYEMAVRKFEHDYALHEAIDKIFKSGDFSMKDFTKGTSDTTKAMLKQVVSKLIRFIF